MQNLAGGLRTHVTRLFDWMIAEQDTVRPAFDFPPSTNRQPRASLLGQREAHRHDPPGRPRLEPIHLFDVAAKQARWLAQSQAVIAGNVSNASTPGFKAQAVQPFADVMASTQLQLASTNAGHLDFGAADQTAAAVKDEAAWETSESGNTVSLEQQMIDAGEVNRSFSLNTSIVKAFHGMLMASVRS